MLVSIALRSDFKGGMVRDTIKQGAHKGLELCTFRWEAVAKRMFTEEKHVITGRARGSINASKGSAPNYIDASKVQSDDGVHLSPDVMYWIGGSNVEYMPDLEKRYGIFARALDEVRGECAAIMAEGIMDALK